MTDALWTTGWQRFDACCENKIIIKFTSSRQALLLKRTIRAGHVKRDTLSQHILYGSQS